MAARASTGRDRQPTSFTLTRIALEQVRGRRDEDQRLEKEIAKAISVTEFPYEEPPEDFDEEEEARPTQGVRLDLPPHNWLRQYIEASQLYVPQVPYAYHLACGLALMSTIVARNVTIANVDANCTLCCGSVGCAV